MPNWFTWVPRLAVVYDVFGNGKTAIKANVSKYTERIGSGYMRNVNPTTRGFSTRPWTDANGDLIPQLTELGAGTPFSGGTQIRYADDVNRPYQWEYSLGVQRELVTGVSVSFNWVRRDFSRLFWTDNTLVSFDDYSPVPIPNPMNPSEKITIYNLSRAKLGQVSQIDRNSDVNKRWYNGYDVGFSARIRGGGNIFGGTSIGRQLTANCDVDDPNSLRYCDQRELDMP